MPSRRDTLYFLGKGVFTPPSRPPLLIEIGASDTTELLERMAALRTIRFLGDR